MVCLLKDAKEDLENQEDSDSNNGESEAESEESYKSGDSKKKLN